MKEQERNLLLNKIKEWQEKSKNETDPFNKYVSIFIAYNIFYNLLEKTKNPTANLKNGDAKRAINTIQLMNDTDNSELLKRLQPLLKAYLELIPIYSEEYWSNKIPISDELKKSYHEQKSTKTIDLLLKWLYAVRCNLVHGDKNYQDSKQKKLLELSSNLLDPILHTLLNNYMKKYMRK